MSRKESLNKPVCQCCMTNLVVDTRHIFCKKCKNFLYKRLRLTSHYVSHKLLNADYNNHVFVRKSGSKCSLCGKKPIISYKHFELNRRFYLCRDHHDRWLRIGCELSELVNKL